MNYSSPLFYILNFFKKIFIVNHRLSVSNVNLLSVSNYKIDRKSTRLNSSHSGESRMPSSAWKKKISSTVSYFENFKNKICITSTIFWYYLVQRYYAVPVFRYGSVQRFCSFITDRYGSIRFKNSEIYIID